MSFPTFILVCFVLFIPTVWAIVNIANRDFSSNKKKLFWGAFVVFMPPVGGIVYLISYQLMRMTRKARN
jgi:hypothetical protein